jgi:hypothetical protein
MSELPNPYERLSTVELGKRVIVALFERLKFWWERFRFEGSLYFQRRRLLFARTE